MGLLTDKVNVTLGGSNIKYYENLGYTIPYVTKNSKTSVPWGTTIMVDIKDLSKGANVTVPVKCDCCGKTGELMYAKYLKNIERNNGQYICKNTAAHTKINSNANLEKLRKQLIDYLSVNNDFPYFEDFTEDNGFTFSYSQRRPQNDISNPTKKRFNPHYPTLARLRLNHHSRRQNNIFPLLHGRCRGVARET